MSLHPPPPREAQVLGRCGQKATGVLMKNAAMDICSATSRIREQKGRRYRAKNVPRRTSELQSDGWGAAVGCLTSVEFH